MLVMTNTGLRPPEARNLLRRDLSEPRTAKDGRSFVPIRVRGKDKYRELVAPMSVNTYLDQDHKLADQRLKALGSRQRRTTPYSSPTTGNRPNLYTLPCWKTF